MPELTPLPIEIPPWQMRDTSEHPAENSQWIYRFANGYGASVIQGPYTYGGNAGLYEIAVAKFADDGSGEWHVNYETPITEYVLGHQSLEDVIAVLVRIAALGNAHA